MLNIISWFALAALMFVLCLMDFANGDIIIGVITGLCCIGDLGFGISEIITRKRIKKMQAEWEDEWHLK